MDRVRALWHVLLGHPVCYKMRIAGSPNFLNGYLISGKFGDFPDDDPRTKAGSIGA